MFCFTFVSDHNIDSLMLYLVWLDNMYIYLNSSLKLSDIVRGLLLTIVLQLVIIIQIHYQHSFYFYIIIFYSFHPHYVKFNTV